MTDGLTGGLTGTGDVPGLVASGLCTAGATGLPAVTPCTGGAPGFTTLAPGAGPGPVRAPVGGVGEVPGLVASTLGIGNVPGLVPFGPEAGGTVWATHVAYSISAAVAVAARKRDAGEGNLGMIEGTRVEGSIALTDPPRGCSLAVPLGHDCSITG